MQKLLLLLRESRASHCYVKTGFVFGQQRIKMSAQPLYCKNNVVETKYSEYCVYEPARCCYFSIREAVRNKKGKRALPPRHSGAMTFFHYDESSH